MLISSIEKIKAEIVLSIENILNGSDCNEYLRNHLVKYLSIINNADSLYQTKIANDLLGNYCIDSLDWDSIIFINCSEIQKLTRKLGKLLEAEKGNK